MSDKKKVDNKTYADALRAVICKMFVARGDGHIGGSFSIADVMAVLFNDEIRDNPKDWFSLSKGHAGPVYYAALYLEGKIPKDALSKLNANGTILPSHPDRNLTPGVDCSTGSLGQGISQAVGLAYACKIKNTKSWVYCIVGDGELNEGETYEALEFASNKKLNNLIVFVDINGKQVDGLVKDVSCDYDYERLFAGLRLKTIEVQEGNDVNKIKEAIQIAKNDEEACCHVILLHTIKGKGITYFENHINCHHVTFNENELKLLDAFAKEHKGDIENVLETTME